MTKIAGKTHKKPRVTVGTYTTTVAAGYMNAIDFRTGEFDREAARKSLYSASTIAGALGAGLTTGLNEYIKLEANFSNDFFASAAKLGVSLAGEALKYGTHVIYNLASGQGKDSFGNAFDDMGGLTFNLLNLSTIASLFGADDKTASGMSLGLFELQITRDGVSSRIGTNGIDVSGLVYSFASWGGEMLRNAAAAAAERTELAGRMAEEMSSEEYINYILLNGIAALTDFNHQQIEENNFIMIQAQHDENSRQNTFEIIINPSDLFTLEKRDVLNEIYDMAFGTSFIPSEIPSDACVDLNIMMTERMDPITWFLLVKNKGHWDYKQQDSIYEDFGNFNYGATGTAMGIPPDILLRGAGWASIKADPNRRRIYGTPFGDKPYGDDPRDAFWIIQGINYANKKLLR